MSNVNFPVIVTIAVALVGCGASTDQDSEAPQPNSSSINADLRDGPSASPTNDNQQSFRRRIEAAYNADDREAALLGLFHLANTDEETRKQYVDRSVPMLARNELETLAFEPLEEDFRSDYAMNGYRYEPDPFPAGYVAINDQTRAPYGMVDGEYYLVGMKRTLVVADPQPEQTVQAIVIGMATPPVEFDGACEVLRSDGKIAEHKIEDFGHGNSTLALNAVRMESCRVTKLSGEGSLSLRVIESDVTLFEASVSAAGEELHYIAQAD